LSIRILQEAFLPQRKRRVSYAFRCISPVAIYNPAHNKAISLQVSKHRKLHSPLSTTHLTLATKNHSAGNALKYQHKPYIMFRDYDKPWHTFLPQQCVTSFIQLWWAPRSISIGLVQLNV